MVNIPSYSLQKIISGGQTGVDRAALAAGLQVGLSIGGWCPPGRQAEDGEIPLEYPLIETPRECSVHAPEVPRSLRTEWNVRDADATLILIPTWKAEDKGTHYTLACCKRLNKPYVLLTPYLQEELMKGGAWLQSKEPSILNVAGPSEASYPGIFDAAYAFLLEIFSK